jgi:hypothetical protein
MPDGKPRIDRTLSASPEFWPSSLVMMVSARYM